MLSMIKVRRDDATDLTIFEAVAPVRAQEILTRMAEFYAGVPTRLVLWDFTNIDLSDISFDDVRTIANLSADRSHDRPGGRTAIVASEQVTYGLSRIYQSYRGIADQSVDTGTFRELSEAEAFLGISDADSGNSSP